MSKGHIFGTILLVGAVAVSLGHPEKEDWSQRVKTKKEVKRADEVPPGSAGHHGAVQSGQFLLTNNDNYGLQISHSPYVSPGEEEGLPNPESLQELPQTQIRSVAAQQTPVVSAQGNNEGLCAGCFTLTRKTDNTNTGGRNQQNLRQFWQNYNRRPAPMPQQQQQQQLQPQPQAKLVAYNNDITGYSYAVSMEGPRNNFRSVQASQFQQQPLRNWQSNRIRQGQRSTWGNMNQQVNNDPSSSAQHLRINDDGGYSFGYTAPDSSRQEQRNTDGTVSGNYGYTDPTGREVRIDYNASPKGGFHAVGNTIPLQNPNPSIPEFQLPTPPPETDEVQAARAKFFEAYDQQLKLIKATQRNQARSAAAEAQASQQSEKRSEPPPSTSQQIVAVHSEKSEEKAPVDLKQQPDQTPSPDGNTNAQVEDDELENDAVVVGREDEPSGIPAAVKIPKPVVSVERENAGPQPSYQLSVSYGGANNIEYHQPIQPTQQEYFQTSKPVRTESQGQARAGPMGSSYQISHMLGGPSQPVPMGYHNTQSQTYQSQPQMTNTFGNNGGAEQPTAPGYFYYVSVGGQGQRPSPNYVTSNLFQSQLPTSLRANMVGAIPLDARHEPQVPHTNTATVQNEGNMNSGLSPVYLDIDPSALFNQNKNTNTENSNNNQPVVGFIPGLLVGLRNNAFVRPTTSASTSYTNNGNKQFPLLLFRS